jgi:transcriptional regulator GlxA family with amidase domain
MPELRNDMLAQVILFDGFDPLDVIAPYEVLWAGGVASGGQLQVELVSLEGARLVPSGSSGVALSAVGAIDLERADVLVVPGAVGRVSGEGPDTIPAILGRAAQSGLPAVIEAAMARPDMTVATVCGGSLILAMAGLLEGRSAVSHHEGLALLEATGAQVVRARVVDDGDLITAGGVTSGLDLALYLLERELGPRVAHSVEAMFDFERRGTVWKAQGAEPVAM